MQSAEEACVEHILKLVSSYVGFWQNVELYLINHNGLGIFQLGVGFLNVHFLFLESIL